MNIQTNANRNLIAFVLKFTVLEKLHLWISLAIQWLEVCLSTAGRTDSICGQGTKIHNGTRPNNIKK